jgi:ankyrin repeat protein
MNGADTEARDNSTDWTPLHFACCNGHLAVVIEWLSPSNGTTIILGKAQGADTEARDLNGDTPFAPGQLLGPSLTVAKAFSPVAARTFSQPT